MGKHLHMNKLHDGRVAYLLFLWKRHKWEKVERRRAMTMRTRTSNEHEVVVKYNNSVQKRIKKYGTDDDDVQNEKNK